MFNIQSLNLMNIKVRKLMICAVVFGFLMIFVIEFATKMKFENQMMAGEIMTRKNDFWMILVPKNDAKIACADLKNVANSNESWHMVVVDINTSACKARNMVTIQSEWYNNLLEAYSDDVMKRKMAGYIFAIQNGAKYIYELKENLILSKNSMQKFVWTNRKKYLVSKMTGVIDPNEHFGRDDFKLSGLESLYTESNNTYSLVPRPMPVLQHSAYLRGTDKDQFDATAPPFVLGSNSIALVDYTNTLVASSVFWVLFLPPSIKGMYSELARSIWAQKLLNIGNYSVAFLGPNYAMEVLGSMKKSVNETHKLKNMAHFLLSWSCKEKLEQCSLLLGRKFVELGLWHPVDMHVFSNWLKILKNYGLDIKENVEVRRLVDVHHHLKKEFLFYPVPKGPGKEQAHRNLAKKTCSDICGEKRGDWLEKVMKEKRSKFEDVVLIVHFNYASNPNVLKMIHLLYKSQFPTMVICGHRKDWESLEGLKLTFIPSYPSHNTMNSIDCSTIAMQMGYHVAGFLQTHDDNILHPWHMTLWDRSKVWYTKPHKWLCAVGDAMTGNILHENGSLYNNKAMGLPSWIYPTEELPKLPALFEEMQESVLGSSFRRCHENKVKRLYGTYRFDYSQADHFYVPKRLAEDFVNILTLFIEGDVFFEIAIPTALRCLEFPNNFQIIPFRHLYGPLKDNNKLDSHYNTHLNYSYVHPYKLGYIDSDNGLRSDLFCQKIIGEAYNRW